MYTSISRKPGWNWQNTRTTSQLRVTSNAALAFLEPGKSSERKRVFRVTSNAALAFLEPRNSSERTERSRCSLATKMKREFRILRVSYCVTAQMKTGIGRFRGD